MSLLKTENLCIAFGELRAVDGVNIEIKELKPILLEPGKMRTFSS